MNPVGTAKIKELMPIGINSFFLSCKFYLRDINGSSFIAIISARRKNPMSLG
jgi:hypothetical protein